MNTIEKLESLQGMIADDKGTILLVSGGLKPAGLVVVQGEPFRRSSEIVHIHPSVTTTLDEILEDLNIKYFTATTIMDALPNKIYDQEQEVMRIFISKNQETAQQLMIAFDDLQNNHHLVGTLLGYPGTAIDAFLTPDMLELSNHPTATQEVSETNMRLLGHRLSKAHWRDEVKYLEPAGNYIKSVSSKIYSEATAEDAV